VYLHAKRSGVQALGRKFAHRVVSILSHGGMWIDADAEIRMWTKWESGKDNGQDNEASEEGYNSIP